MWKKSAGVCAGVTDHAGSTRLRLRSIDNPVDFTQSIDLVFELLGGGGIRADVALENPQAARIIAERHPFRGVEVLKGSVELAVLDRRRAGIEVETRVVAS